MHLIVAGRRPRAAAKDGEGTPAVRRARHRLPMTHPHASLPVGGVSSFYFCSLFFQEAKREPEKKAGNPPGLARRARPSAERTFPAKKYFAGLFFVLFLSVKEKEPKRKLRNPPGLARCSRPSAERTFPAKNILRGFSERKAPQGKTESACRGRPARWGTLIPLPVKVSFLWFFLSFPERKERTLPPCRRAQSRVRPARWFALISHPDKVSFLWFFLFFSRKKRKNRKKGRTEKRKNRKRECGKSQARAGWRGPVRYALFTR